MAIKFAKRMEGLNGSEIRELLKLTEKPEVISFAGGLPAPELFPVEEMKEISKIVLDESGTQALQYSTTDPSFMEKMPMKRRVRETPVTISGLMMGRLERFIRRPLPFFTLFRPKAPRVPRMQAPSAESTAMTREFTRASMRAS